MPSKCPFCRRKYIRAGAYETHLRTAQANLDIVLASTVGYPSSGEIINDVETSTLHQPEASELQDSDYEYDPDSTGHELNPFTAHDSDTEIPDDSTSSLPGTQEDYPRAGEAIGDVDRFEQENSNLCEDRWAPLSCPQGFKLASWFIQSKVPKSQINEYFSSGLGSSALVSSSCMHTLENHLRSLERHSSYLQWFEGQVEDSKELCHSFIVMSWIVSDISFAISHTRMTWPMRRGMNSILMVKGSMCKCTLRTGGGMCKYSALTSFTVTVADSL